MMSKMKEKTNTRLITGENGILLNHLYQKIEQTEHLDLHLELAGDP